MTNRYAELINAIHATDTFIVQIFLFALALIIAYPILDWTPVWMRRPAKYLYLTFPIAALILTTVYSASR